MSSQETIVTEALLCQLASEFNGKKIDKPDIAITKGLKQLSTLYSTLKSLSSISYLTHSEDCITFINNTSKKLITVFRGQALPFKSLREAVNFYKSEFKEAQGQKNPSHSYIDTLAVYFTGTPTKNSIDRSAEYCDKLNQKFTNYSHLLCGHAVGGSIANEVSKQLKLKCDGFNSTAPFLDSLSVETCDTSREFRTTGDSFSSRMWAKESPNTTFFVGGDTSISSFTGLKGNVLDSNSKCEIDYSKIVIGGIDLASTKKQETSSKKVSYDNITGITVNERTSEVNFLSESNLKQQGVSLQDLAVPLLVYYDPDIKHKKISFSLDPADPKNPRGPNLRKVFYPDEWEGRDVIRGTEFGEILFEADWLMKQLSMGIKVKSMSPVVTEDFPYPKDIKEKGVYLYHDDEPTEKWQRLWLEIGHLDMKQIKMDPKTKIGQGFVLKNLQVKINARQMVIGEDGKLKDKLNQDSNDSCYKFAKAFSDCYNDVSKHFPIFEKLKKLFKAMALAEWMYFNRVPIDLDAIKHQVESTRLSKEKYGVIVPALANELVSGQLKIKLFGGVNLSVGLQNIYVKKSQDDKSDKDEVDSQSTMDQSMDNISFDVIDEIPQNNEKLDFPYSKAVQCTVCKKDLTAKEIHVATLTGLGNFCSIHHSHSCMTCGEIIFNEAMAEIQNKRFHPKCLKCPYCNLPLEGKFYVLENALMHQECISEYSVEQTRFKKEQGLVSIFTDKPDEAKQLKPTVDSIVESMIKYFANLKHYNIDRLLFYFIKVALEDAKDGYIEKYKPNGFGYQIGYSAAGDGLILKKAPTQKVVWSDQSIEKTITASIKSKKSEEKEKLKNSLPELENLYSLELRSNLDNLDEVPLVLTLKLTLEGKK